MISLSEGIFTRKSKASEDTSIVKTPGEQNRDRHHGFAAEAVAVAEVLKNIDAETRINRSVKKAVKKGDVDALVGREYDIQIGRKLLPACRGLTQIGRPDLVLKTLIDTGALQESDLSSAVEGTLVNLVKAGQAREVWNVISLREEFQANYRSNLSRLILSHAVIFYELLKTSEAHHVQEIVARALPQLLFETEGQAGQTHKLENKNSSLSLNLTLELFKAALLGPLRSEMWVLFKEVLPRLFAIKETKVISLLSDSFRNYPEAKAEAIPLIKAYWHHFENHSERTIEVLSEAIGPTMPLEDIEFIFLQIKQGKFDFSLVSPVILKRLWQKMVEEGHEQLVADFLLSFEDEQTSTALNAKVLLPTYSINQGLEFVSETTQSNRVFEYVTKNADKLRKGEAAELLVAIGKSQPELIFKSLSVQPFSKLERGEKYYILAHLIPGLPVSEIFTYATTLFNEIDLSYTESWPSSREIRPLLFLMEKSLDAGLKEEVIAFFEENGFLFRGESLDYFVSKLIQAGMASKVWEYYEGFDQDFRIHDEEGNSLFTGPTDLLSKNKLLSELFAASEKSGAIELFNLTLAKLPSLNWNDFTTFRSFLMHVAAQGNPEAVTQLISRSPAIIKKLGLAQGNLETDFVQFMAKKRQIEVVKSILNSSPSFSSLFNPNLKKIREALVSAEKAEQYEDVEIPPEAQDDEVEQILMNLEETKIKAQRALLESVRKSFKLIGEKKIPEDLSYALRQLMRRMDIPQLHFLRLIIESEGVFSSRLQKILVEPSALAQLAKTGSELQLGLGEFSGIVINNIEKESAEVWKQLAHELNTHGNTVIPVAPYLREYKASVVSQVKVVSRYCGLNAEALTQLLPSDNPASGHLLHLITKERSTIIANLRSKKIDHGHPHQRNMTVEFIDKEYYEHQLLQGETVNTIRYSNTEFTFDPLVYLKNPSKYKVVVRLIDWDKAKRTS